VCSCTIPGPRSNLWQVTDLPYTALPPTIARLATAALVLIAEQPEALGRQHAAILLADHTLQHAPPPLAAKTAPPPAIEPAPPPATQPAAKVAAEGAAPTAPAPARYYAAPLLQARRAHPLAYDAALGQWIFDYCEELVRRGTASASAKDAARAADLDAMDRGELPVDVVVPKDFCPLKM
jgi:hypothetical protein